MCIQGDYGGTEKKEENMNEILHFENQFKKNNSTYLELMLSYCPLALFCVCNL